jgi:hypothetical protein
MTCTTKESSRGQQQLGHSEPPVLHGVHTSAEFNPIAGVHWGYSRQLGLPLAMCSKEQLTLWRRASLMQKVW